MTARWHTPVLELVLVLLLCYMAFCLPATKTLADNDRMEGHMLSLLKMNQGVELDIFDGDKKVTVNRKTRNATNHKNGIWPKTIPYYLENELGPAVRARIISIFEDLQLKTCLNFKPWNGEQGYIYIHLARECDNPVTGYQNQRIIVVLMKHCTDYGNIAQQLMRVLGFWPEHQRPDRNDYLRLIPKNIVSGKADLVPDDKIDNYGIPYDYESIAHIDSMAISSNNQPSFLSQFPVISTDLAQRVGFSESDVLKINRRHECAYTTTLLDSCDFESKDICGMIQGQDDTSDWIHVIRAAGGPAVDQSLSGKCKGSGYFMHFSTGNAKVADTARLESRIFHPKRDHQCLEFFFYNSASSSDTLKIFVKEYNKTNLNGTLRFIKTINGPPRTLWQVHHVSLNIKTKFRVIFQATKESTSSEVGGMSLDDITLSETVCPDFVWEVPDFDKLMRTSGVNVAIESPHFTSREGYTFDMSLYPRSTQIPGDHMGLYIHMVSPVGQSDAGLKWPFMWRQITMSLMDQKSNIKMRRSHHFEFVTPTKDESEARFEDDPRLSGTLVTNADGVQYFRTQPGGTSKFFPHTQILKRDYIKGGKAVFYVTITDVFELTQPQPLPNDPANLAGALSKRSNLSSRMFDYTDCSDLKCQNAGVCIMDGDTPRCRCVVETDWWFYGEECQHKGSIQEKANLALACSLSVLGVMLVILTMSLTYMTRKQDTIGEDNTHEVMKEETGSSTHQDSIIH